MKPEVRRSSPENLRDCTLLGSVASTAMDGPMLNQVPFLPNDLGLTRI